MQKSQERLMISFSTEQDFLHFYTNLPKKIQRQLSVFHKWHSLTLQKEDYEKLKVRVAYPIHIEDNVFFKLHVVSQNEQIIPWGVAAIKAPETWSQVQGQGVKVGIIDTGIDGGHPDLRGNVRGGINTVDKTSPLLDQNGHGTHVAGTIAAVNNHFGVVGVGPSADIYSLKAFAKDGTASLENISKAINWAIDHKIQVLNMSFGSPTSSPSLHRAIQTAYRHGILLIASAGNNGDQVEYPAKFSEVLAVGAVGEDKEIADFSNYGKELNFIAPGVDILSTWPVPPYYNTLSGTSMAAPHIAGICALLLSKNPSLSHTDVQTILDQSTVKLKKIPAQRQGKGAVLATKALNNTSPT